MKILLIKIHFLNYSKLSSIMKKLFTLFLAALAVTSMNAQTTLASWGFEGVTTASTAGTTMSITTGSAVADAGVGTTGSAVTAVHANALTVYSNPAGNGSSKSLSSNYWAVGDYYQFKVATTTFSGIKVSWDHTGSNTGPAPFKIQYSTTAGGASGYTDFSTYTIPNNPLATPTAGVTYSWNATTALSPPVTTFSADLSAVTAVNNQSEVYFRLVCTAATAIGATSTFALTGTSRVDNFKVTYDAVIPVEMVSFTAQKAGTTNKLAWQTATELNNQHFDVQRSNDGATFQSIGIVKGVGNSVALNNYEFVDEAPSVGTNYYRLQQVDYNGKTTTSKTVAVNTTGKGSAKVFPTLATDKINVLTTSDKEETFTITNMVGQTVLTGRVVNSLDINVSQLAKGIYILQVAGDAVRFSKQ
jgi:hypothetical protein